MDSFFGFALGVGGSLVVLNAIYSGGYRKALEDSLRSPGSDRHQPVGKGERESSSQSKGKHHTRCSINTEPQPSGRGLSG